MERPAKREPPDAVEPRESAGMRLWQRSLRGYDGRHKQRVDTVSRQLDNTANESACQYSIDGASTNTH